MATRKVLFVLSLALLINPTLHSMNNVDSGAMASVATGLVGLVAYVYAITNNIQRKVLHRSQNTDIFTSQKSTGTGEHTFFKRTDDKFEMYGLFSGKPDEKTLNDFHQQVIKRLLPNKNDKHWDGKLLTLEWMKDKNIKGIVALITPPDNENKDNGKIFVVNSSDNYEASYLRDKIVRFTMEIEKNQLIELVKKIKKRTPQYTDRLSSYIVFTTKNVSKVTLEKILEKVSLFDSTNREIEKCSNSGKEITAKEKEDAIVKGLEEYQKDLIESVFSENKNNGISSKRSKAVFLIPLHKIDWLISSKYL